MTTEEKISNIEKSDVVRFIDYYEDDTSKRIKMTIRLWNDSGHELAELGREFKKKVIEFYKNKTQ